MLPCPSHASHSAHPSPSLSLVPKALSSSVWGLTLCPAPGPPFSLRLYLAAITAHSGQPG